MNGGRAMYKERTWAPPWVWVTMGLACLLSIGPTLYAAYGQAVLGQPAEDMSTRGLMLLAGGIAVLFALFFSVFMCLDVEVHADHLFIAFGPVHLVRKRIRYSDIEGVSAVAYRPFRDFGGWGIRWRGRTTAWTLCGNKAVSVDLQSGKAVYVGSKYPRRLAGRIEAAIGLM